ncbi:peptidoglycan-binding domain-containing protein [Cellulomonas fimi]|uniref:Peptidoglycan-binding domain 1 protein n=1 Tax=Cellulomonas fimi (strain ATCC 484 / DSM 20113 / JCM 1341 / CCUG 24087 / LMG 16345 / NBRC 15513 / NCIMB 8980 / NCTC 7547 / NRS-133) TaxID=590998 RepID=F4H4Q2_CELFA|nr:peptidoglycan-binding domain-containing protein [Cellulomonas fimi]AEE44253.1 Peptidoglycan-binding domain 1 protein [Cellulomonas fimi ATCC 484]NNH05700.1 peptidoglycan-binding protein [Cellulomonas fimi]VEH25976.1 Putative peptidoglycan binding domain [Cellulomonas fimi]
MRARVVGVWVLSVAVALAAGWWAADATLRPPQVADRELPPATYAVVEGTVGETLDVSAEAVWAAHPVAALDRAGKVTSVDVAPGDVLEQGDVLLTVDLVPVTVAAGDVPAFRALTSGLEGPDVRQLQQLLADLGHLRSAPDGRFRASTTAAVRSWQKASGRPVTGEVPLGDVVFVPGLPARVVLADGVAVGRSVGAGDAAVSAVEPTPTLTVRLAADQRSRVPAPGTPVTVDLGDGRTVVAVTQEPRVEDDGTLVLDLRGSDGGPACPEPCAVPYAAQAQRFPAEVEVAPARTGPTVPLAALGSAADGSTFVTRADGTRASVQVVASDGSRAVVDGLRVGDEVRLFAEGHPAAASDDEPTAPAPRATG